MSNAKKIKNAKVCISVLKRSAQKLIYRIIKLNFEGQRDNFKTPANVTHNARLELNTAIRPLDNVRVFLIQRLFKVNATIQIADV